VIYDCSGLRIASEIPLSAPRSESEAARIDVTIELGESIVPPFEPPSDDVIAELIVDGHPKYAIYRVDGGFVCRFTTVGDFFVSSELSKVVCHPVADGRTEVIPIVIAGTIVSFLMTMGGRCVLHGSAVQLGSQALAFVGVSGQGKSTMAAIFCASGAPLITDDVLPLELEEMDDGRHAVRCLRAGTEIRLREKSASLADRFGNDASVRITVDERRAVEPNYTDSRQIPLAGIVLPRPDRDQSEVHARVLGPGEASLWLGRCQRIEGWQGRDHLRQQFIDVGRVVGAVPVFEVAVPWGPPFAEDLPERILKACELSDVFSDR
jgi:hypothetical protein